MDRKGTQSPEISLEKENALEQNRNPEVVKPSVDKHDVTIAVMKTEVKRSPAVLRNPSGNRSERDKRQTVAATSEITLFGERKVANRSSLYEMGTNWDELDKPKSKPEKNESKDENSAVVGGTEYANVFNKFKRNASQKKADIAQEASAIEHNIKVKTGGFVEIRKPCGDDSTTPSSRDVKESVCAPKTSSFNKSKISASAVKCRGEEQLSTDQILKPVSKKNSVSTSKNLKTVSIEEKPAGVTQQPSKTLITERQGARTFITEKQSRKTVMAEQQTAQVVESTIIEKLPTVNQEDETSKSNVGLTRAAEQKSPQTKIVLKGSFKTDVMKGEIAKSPTADTEYTNRHKNEACSTTDKRGEYSNKKEADGQVEKAKPTKSVTLVVEEPTENKKSSTPESINKENLYKRKLPIQKDRSRSQTLPEQPMVKEELDRKGSFQVRARISQDKQQLTMTKADKSSSVVKVGSGDQVQRSHSFKPVGQQQENRSEKSSDSTPSWIALARQKTKDWGDRDPEKDTGDKNNSQAKEIPMKRFSRM